MEEIWSIIHNTGCKPAMLTGFDLLYVFMCVDLSLFVGLPPAFVCETIRLHIRESGLYYIRCDAS